MPGKDIVQTKMGMFLVRLRDRKKDHNETPQSKSHPKGSASAAPPNQMCPLPQEVMLRCRARPKLPLGPPRAQGQTLSTKQLLAEMPPHPQVPHGARPHPSSTAVTWPLKWDRHHLSRTKPGQRCVEWTGPLETRPAPMYTYTHTHTGAGPGLLGELCHLSPVQLPALGQLCGEGGQHDVLQQHGGAVASSLQVLKEIRPRNRLEKSRGGALRPCRTLNHAHFYWS